jgi:hypothetical protein
VSPACREAARTRGIGTEHEACQKPRLTQSRPDCAINGNPAIRKVRPANGRAFARPAGFVDRFQFGIT